MNPQPAAHPSTAHKSASRHVALVLAASLVLGACTSNPVATPAPAPAPGSPAPRSTGQTAPSQAKQDQLSPVMRALICGAAGGAGYAIGKQIDKKSRNPKSKNAAITLALLGCVGGDALAGTVYAKLSENGRRAREAALIEASRTGRVQSYKDDQSPTLTGTVTPGNRTQDAANGMCVVNTDYLADAGKGEKVFVKMCQQADGGWAPVVS